MGYIPRQGKKEVLEITQQYNLTLSGWVNEDFLEEVTPKENKKDQRALSSQRIVLVEETACRKYKELQVLKVGGT